MNMLFIRDVVSWLIKKYILIYQIHNENIMVGVNHISIDQLREMVNELSSYDFDISLTSNISCFVITIKKEI